MVSVVWKSRPTGAVGPRQIPGTVSDSRKAVNYIQLCLQCVYLASYGRFLHQKLAKVPWVFFGHHAQQPKTLPCLARWPGDSSWDDTTVASEHKSSGKTTDSAWDESYSVTSRQN